MNSLIVGFSRPKKWKLLSWLIMKVEKTNYSHAYIKIYAKSYDRWLIYQATGNGVFFWAEQEFNLHSQPVLEKEIVISDAAKAETVTWCLDQLGKEYGKTQLLGMALCKLFKLNKLFKNGNRQFVCSELVAMALEKAQVIKNVKDQDNMGLKELSDLIKEITV